MAVVAVAVAVGLALTGCDSGRDGDSADAASTEPSESSSAAPTNTYVVDSGDTLSGIAASYGLSLNELVEVNDWSEGADHAIFPGDVIGLPDDAVAVSTTRPPSDNSGDSGGDDDDTGGTSQGTPNDEATTGGYTSLGEGYAGPDLGDSTAPITDPLADGVYWSWDQTVSGDGSAITFQLVQKVSGEACREHFGTSPESCASDIAFIQDPTTTASMRVGSGTASVLQVDATAGPFATYRITSEELARLISGEPPADDAPDGFVFDSVDAFVVTVQNGAATAADQIWIS